ncbi:PAS domain S-box protein [Azonexus sp. IMCC34839]|uniref:PAS domain S-box protein n=1 Tax=Azonexus sp. IMCC34839 TaxID=3133695 RepID=UPI00399B8198
MTSPGDLPSAALAEALALAGVGCWLWQAPDRLSVSPAFLGLLGLSSENSPSDAPGWLALAHPDDRANFADLLTAIAQGEGKIERQFSLRLQHANGLWCWFELRSKALADTGIVISFSEITQQKQAMAALRDSQLRFRALYNTSPLAFVLWEREGRIVEWNRRAEQIFGWPAEQVIGKPIHRLLLPADQHGDFSANNKAMLHSEGDGRFTGPALHRDGRLLHCNWYSVPLYNINGQLLGILSLILDVTPEYLAQKRLEKSEQTYRTLVETSPDAILLLATNGCLQMANQQAQRLFGLDIPTDLGKLSFRRLLAEGDAELDFLANPEEFAGLIAHRQMRLRSKLGESFDATLSLTTTCDNHGRPTGSVLFVRDVTESLRAERELQAHRDNLEQLIQERTLELESAHDSLSKIIDGSPVPTFVLDADHTITHWNQACERIFGAMAEDMIGTRDQWRGFYPSPRPVMADLVLLEGLAEIEQLYADKYRPSPLVKGAYEAEDYFPKFDRWMYFTAAPLRDRNGKLFGAIETLQDISERKKAEIALSEAKLFAEQAATAKAEFLANMSHEIRTPMNAVIGLAHLLLKTELSGKQRDYIERIHGAGQMLLGLINDILDFSKIEAGRMQIEHTDFLLDDVLDKVSTVVMHRAQEKGLELQYVVEPDVPQRLIGDPLRLAQILINLIGNAIKFTARGSVTVFLRRASAESGHMRLECDVQDTGIGMTADQLATLFQAFSQADTSITRKFGGTGLGLTICKRLTQLMGGDIRAESQPGVGSTFSFSVRLGVAAGEVATPNTCFKRALVVDDNPLARSILIRLLEKHGFQCTAADSGEQAQRQIEENAGHRFDIVTIDLNMPGMNGYELGEIIRNELGNEPLLAMVTAADTSDFDFDIEKSPFDAIVNKPVTAQQIAQLLDARTIRQASAGSTLAPMAGLRILLVEDIPTNQLIACEMLESFGATVDTAGNGVQALRKLIDEAIPCDVVLMDVQMPEMDGLEATRRLRASGRYDRLPIIAMTAHALDQERQRCLAAGMNDFISKPIDPDQLHQMLQRWRPKTENAGAPLPQEKKTMSTPEGLPELPGIDTALGMKRMMNKVALYEKVLRDFHNRFANEAAQIRATWEAGDFTAAERRAHSTKGLAGTIGATALQEAALALEYALKEGQAPADVYDRFAQELRTVIDGIAKAFDIPA